MKKLIVNLTLASFLTTSLMAKSVYVKEYQMHSNVFNPSFNIATAERKEVFFGTKKDYYSELSSGIKAIQTKGLNGALEGGLNQSANLAKGFFTTAGKGMALSGLIGGFFGYIDNYIKENRKTAEYMYVVDFTAPDGTTTRGNVLLSSYHKDFKDEPKMDKIKEIMRGGF